MKRCLYCRAKNGDYKLSVGDDKRPNQPVRGLKPTKI